MKLYKLNKTVLSIRNNPAQFLNGLTANTLDKPRNVFLNIHGRIIVVFDQIKVREDEFWIIIGTPYLDALFQHIERYIKLSKVHVEKLNKYVYFDVEESSHSMPAEEVVIPQKKGRVIVSDSELENAVHEKEFTLFRLKNNIPIHGIDYTDEFVLNVGGEDFVSFTKGCFLGQEPVAKVHNRSKPTWQLAVKYEDECGQDEKEKMTSKELDPDTNRVVGFTFIHNQ